MSLSSTTSRNNYIGNNSTDTYYYTFRILDESDLRVTVRDTSDVETELVLTTDYTVSGVGASGGGSITLIDGNLATDYVLTIRRVIEIVQETDIRNQGAFFPEVHEDQFDRGIMIAQQQQDELDRSMKLAETVNPSDFSPILPAGLASNPGATVIVNPGGDGFEVGPTADAITQAAADAASAENHKITANRWANLTSGTVVDAETSVDSLEYSAKEYAQGTQASTGGSAKDWASKTSAAVSGGEYSSKEWAKGTQTRGVASGGSAKDWANYTGGTVDDSEYSAKKYAADSALSAAQAAASASASMWSDVQYLTSASSPKTIVDADTGVLFEVDCSGGNVVINLPSIAALTLTNPWAVGFKKTDSSANTITINRDGSDTIDGNTSKVISRQYAGCTLVPDIDPSPDRWTSLTFGEVPIGGDIVGTTDTQTLSNKTFSDPITIAEVATPSTPSSGFGKIYFKSDGSLYQLNDDGTESKVGSGSGGVKNLITNGSADEAAASIFTTYADAAATRPVDGTGGSPNVTTSITSSTPLDGTKSFLLTKDAANRQGQGWSVEFSVDPAYRAKSLKISVDYIVNSGTFVAGSSSTESDIIWYLYDVTNSALIEPSNIKMFSNSSTIADKYEATFQTSATGSSYRLIAHVASTSASAYELKVDNITVSPSVYVFGTPVTDWQSFTPLWKSSGTQPSIGNGVIEGQKRRVGGDYEYRVTIKIGSTTSLGTGNYQIELSETIDTSKFGTANLDDVIIGNGSLSDQGVARFPVSVYKGGSITNKQVAIYVANDGTSPDIITFNQVWGASTPITMNTSDEIDVSFSVPVLGASSSVQTSDNAETRVVAASYGTTGTTLPASDGTVVLYPSKRLDTHNSYNTTTGIYTIPVSGIYRINHSIITGSSASNKTFVSRIRKNGVALSSAIAVRESAVNSQVGWDNTTVAEFKAGDSLDFTIWQIVPGDSLDGISSSNYFSVERLSGPSAIAANETISARVYKSGTQAFSSDTKMTSFTVDKDSHGMWDSTNNRFNIQASGDYFLTIQVNASTAGASQIPAYKVNGGSSVFIGSLTNSTSDRSGGSTLIPNLKSGDYIELYHSASASVTVQAGNSNTFATLHRI